MMKSNNTTVELLASSSLGGGELVGLHLAEAVRAGGRDVAVWVPGRGAAHQESISRGLNTRIVPVDTTTNRNPFSTASIYWSVWKALRQSQADIIHVHSAFAYGCASRALNAGRAKRVAHVHIDADANSFRWAFRTPPELIITCAEFLKQKVADALSDNILRRTRLEAVPNAVDTGRYFAGDRSESKSRLGVSKDKPVVLMLANLAPHKGQTTALRTTAELKRRGIEVECWLAGVEREGNDFERQLRSIVDELRIGDRVRFLGFRTDSDMLLRAADVLLLPSTHEGLPLVILEAQASKVPVLAAPTAGIPEIVEDGKTGFLVAADDATGYADRIEALLNQPRLRDSIETSALKQVFARHTWSTYTKRVLSLYDELTTNHRHVNVPEETPVCTT